MFHLGERTMGTNLDYFRDLIYRKPLRTAVVLGCFLGFLTATAGLAIYPPLSKPAAFLACRGELVVDSQSYSMVNSESGVNRYFYCVDASGTKTPANLKIGAAVALLYSAFFTILARAVFVVTRKLWP